MWEIKHQTTPDGIYVIVQSDNGTRILIECETEQDARDLVRILWGQNIYITLEMPHK